MTEEGKPKQAASVILLRPAKSGGFEVFLTRRSSSTAFLDRMYGFPGGSVRKEDYSAGMLRRCHGLSANDARKIVGAHLTPPEALGLWIAGIRELFAGAGILFAVNEAGEHVALEPNRQARLANKRAALLAKALSFEAVLESESLLCDASMLAYFSFWQTPSPLAMRFDTCFYLAALPEDQTPLLTACEVSPSLWLTPDHALSLFQRDELLMIFPTFACLRTLADFETMDSVFRQYHPLKKDKSIQFLGASHLQARNNK